MKKSYLLLILLFSFFLPFFWNLPRVYAELTNVKDTISTSRPSAMMTLNVGASAGAGQVILTSSGARFIASDSALLVGAPGANEVLTIASMSAVSGSTAALYFTTNLAGNHNVGATALAAISAQHVVSFTTNNVPASGNIKVIFPVGDTANVSWPSPNGFSFNGLTSAGVGVSFAPSGPTCSSWTITGGTGLVQCNIGTGITGTTQVFINIGVNSTSPVLVNPTKSAAAGTQDSWTVKVETYDASALQIDSIKAKIATVESVEVYALVEPFINFVISGLTNAQAVNVGNTSGCTNTETINTGFDTTATEVNLGVLGASQINIGAQLLTVSTNGLFGYSLTATASGHLIDSALGYWIADAQGTPTANDLPVPSFLTAGTTAFGIHACGQDINASTWGTGTTGGGANAKYANPSATYYYTLANDSSGPIGGGSADGYGDGLTTVEYASTISTIVPAGLYHNTLTYVATATF